MKTWKFVAGVLLVLAGFSAGVGWTVFSWSSTVHGATGDPNPALKSVAHDATLSGDGTVVSPIEVANGGVTAPKLSTSATPSPGQILGFNGSNLAWQDAPTGPMLWNVYITGGFFPVPPSFHVASFTPSNDITLTRIEAHSINGPHVGTSPCAVNPSIQVANGTAQYTETLASPNPAEDGMASTDSGLISVAFLASTRIDMFVLAGVPTSCSFSGLNIAVQYRTR